MFCSRFQAYKEQRGALPTIREDSIFSWRKVFCLVYPAPCLLQRGTWSLDFYPTCILSFQCFDSTFGLGLFSGHSDCCWGDFHNISSETEECTFFLTRTELHEWICLETCYPQSIAFSLWRHPSLCDRVAPIDLTGHSHIRELSQDCSLTVHHSCHFSLLLPSLEHPRVLSSQDESALWVLLGTMTCFSAISTRDLNSSL